MKKHRAGKKISGSHTSVTKDAAAVVDVLQRMPEVDKIVLSVIQNKRATRRVAFRKEPAGWRVTVCSPSAVQTLYVYTRHRKVVRARIQALYA